MSDTVIRVENLGKKYIIGHQQQERYTSLRDVITNKVKSLGNLINSNAKVENPAFEEFWALKDVSFDIKQGDRVGIIGRNGAGKSTLLKILSRITEPTKGSIKIKGRVASLLEVGTGFHPELTGRENIFLNGAILGMGKEEIKRKFDEIVAFAEVEKFLDTPVKRYSSGMYVRLAFAVAAHLEPEILIVDEVLAVGDAAFQKKCLGKMEDVGKEGRTVLFVSHNISAIKALCQRGLVFRSGQLLTDEMIMDAVSSYHYEISNLKISANTEVGNYQNRRGIGSARFIDIQVQNSKGEKTFSFQMGDTVIFAFSLEIFENLNDLYVGVSLKSSITEEFVTSTIHEVTNKQLRKSNKISIAIEFPDINIRTGDYKLYFLLRNNLEGKELTYDVIDDLTPPLNIYTNKTIRELGYNPVQRVGFFDISSRIIYTEDNDV
jgi:lipopolysaccharide transport system ATP-binding protein